MTTPHYQFRLFVSGRAGHSKAAIDNLNQLCERTLAGSYDLEIVDVLESPELAEQARILATPTLLKIDPPPVRRIIGDLSKQDRVLSGLDLAFREPASLGPAET